MKSFFTIGAIGAIIIGIIFALMGGSGKNIVKTSSPDITSLNSAELATGTVNHIDVLKNTDIPESFYGEYFLSDEYGDLDQNNSFKIFKTNDKQIPKLSLESTWPGINSPHFGNIEFYLTSNTSNLLNLKMEESFESENNKEDPCSFKITQIAKGFHLEKSGDCSVHGGVNVTFSSGDYLKKENKEVLQNATNSVKSEIQNNKQIKINMNNFENKEIIKVIMSTNMGDIVLELNNKQMPITAQNFAKLASEGYYNGIKFHRVINGFMIQAGDPYTKDDSKQNLWGQGGPGYKFADEKMSADIIQNGYKRGVIAMANSGPNTNGSQFFIMHKDYPLSPSYTIFGKVVSGLETVDKIATVKTIYPGQLDRPESPVIINSISVE